MNMFWAQIKLSYEYIVLKLIEETMYCNPPPLTPEKKKKDTMRSHKF